MKYEPKSSLQDINDYGHFLNRGAWMTASGYGRKFLSDLQHCESCLAEAEREIARLKKREAELVEAGDAMYTWGDFTRATFNVDSNWAKLNSEGRAGT